MMGGVSFGPSAVAAFIVFIGILIFVHELGHFLAAKYFNIKVLKFSLGFGPPLVSFRRGETQYQIAAVPFGGYVKMVGDAPGEEIDPADRARSFTSAPIRQRAIIALAGPAFNLVFPILCFFAYYLLGPEVIAPVVGRIEIGTPAQDTLKRGDRILAVDGSRTFSFNRLKELVSTRPGDELTLRVLRDGQELDVKVTPMSVTKDDVFGSPEQQGVLGVTPDRAGSRIGVDDPRLNRGGFLTGDRLLSIAGKPVERAEDVEAAIKENAGKTVEVSVARPSPLAAGDLLLADAESPVKLSVPIPADANGVAALGLMSSDPFVRGVVPGGAADRAGLRPGDRIVSVDGREISLFWSFASMMTLAQKKPVELSVKRNGELMTVTLVNDAVTRKHEVTGKDREFYDSGIGIGPYPRTLESQHWLTSAPEEIEVVELSIAEAFVASVRQTGGVIGMVGLGLYKLFAREISVDTVGGPLMLFQVAAQAAELGLFAYLHMLAWISVNLGLVNLLPIPIFDGGHLLFCAIEGVRKKPLSLRAREMASIVGLVLLLALIVLAMRNDIARLDLF